MTVLADLLVGPLTPRPTLTITLEQGSDHVAVVAKHSEDSTSQTLLELRYHEGTGVLEVLTRDIHAPKLAELCNVPLKGGVRTRFVDKSS